MTDATARAEELIALFGTRDPFRIASLLEITVKYINTRRQKGLCAVIADVPFIFVNRNMSEQMQRLTCAHELGHLLLHERILQGNQPLLEYELFNMQTSAEYEANAFAASLLIDADDLNELLDQGADMIQAASSLDVNVNLLMIRILELQKQGIPIRAPFTPKDAFLGTIEDKADSI